MHVSKNVTVTFAAMALTDEDEEIGALVYYHSRTAKRTRGIAEDAKAEATGEGCNVDGIQNEQTDVSLRGDLESNRKENDTVKSIVLNEQNASVAIRPQSKKRKNSLLVDVTTQSSRSTRNRVPRAPLFYSAEGHAAPPKRRGECVSRRVQKRTRSREERMDIFINNKKCATQNGQRSQPSKICSHAGCTNGAIRRSL
mmetsp:Transcript_36067/g.75950  ORF Transcript_36067/g.75950 Transcript_36067/m.75950 type:complete len:198 (+) Transcript_36067:2-595(+)